MIKTKRIYIDGVWDMFHYGHVNFMKKCKEKGDILIVGICSDEDCKDYKRIPVITMEERTKVIEGCKYVDEIVPYATEQDLEDVLRSFHIDVRIIGDEYANKKFTGRDYCEKKGIDLYFNKREHRFSSSGLRKEVHQKESLKAKDK